MNGDRRVHAIHATAEIVRYNRAGKWYIEWVDGTRKAIDVTSAARMALQLHGKGGTIVHGVSGGQRFDNLVGEFGGARLRATP